jgi:glyoxylase-like metal-dependent hydrolase (beta-lactamase superfamily II)
MKINNLFELNDTYTSNVYLLTGDWNTLGDLNTLIDVGRDYSILERIDKAPTGVGKQRIEQVILTHSHYDHAGLLPVIKEKYNPKVFAFSQNIDCVDKVLKGGEILKIADRQFEVIHITGHSNDSICLYCEEERVLFTGDTPLIIRSKDHIYEQGFIKVLTYISTKNIDGIYFGHGKPLLNNCNATILRTLENISK